MVLGAGGVAFCEPYVLYDNCERNIGHDASNAVAFELYACVWPIAVC